MIIHKCDLCSKENKNMITIQVPINKYTYAVSKKGIKLAKFKSSVKLSNVEICPTCASTIANFLDSLGIFS